MSRDNNRVLTAGRFASAFAGIASLALFAAIPACGEGRSNDLPLPLLMWSQEAGNWDEPSSHCVYTRKVDGEWNAWQYEWCEKPDGKATALGAMSPAARDAIDQGFQALKRADPHGRFGHPPCPTNRRHIFAMEEPFPMLEEPTTWTMWELCAGAQDDLTNLEEPFAAIAKAFLTR